MRGRIKLLFAACVVLAAITAAPALRGRAQRPDWHCCTYTCYNPNSPDRTRQAYYCHPTGTCPAQPANEHSSAEVCTQNGPAVKADTCQECVNRNH
jgi:hypothetical protein